MSSNSKTTQIAVLDAVRKWQTRLLDLNRRNTLLYFSVGKHGVPITEIKPDELMERLADSGNGLSFTHAERIRQAGGTLFPVPAESADATTNVDASAGDPDEGLEQRIRMKPGDLKSDLSPLELQNRLGKLQKRHREWLEEQGLNVLFIAFGFLRWVDEEQKPGAAPLLLVPCELTRTSPRDPYFVRVDDADDISINATLRYKLKQTAGVELPDFDELSIETYLDKVRRLVAKHDLWSVEATITMAAFPFSKLAMWDDLDRMVTDGVKHPLVRRMAGDLGAAIPEPNRDISPLPRNDDELVGAKLDDLLDVRDQFAVLDADFSQLRAIQLARSGTNLVIHGPPGTGKSQTIANIVATLLADGRRVLFVSEKTAALDVVKRRLAEVGLGEFCLDLHSERGRKSSVYSQLRESMRASSGSSRPFPYGELTRTRNELNAVVRALHRIRQPLDQTVFDVHGQIATIGNVPMLVLPLPDIADIDESRLASIRGAAQAIARREAEFRAHHDSRWHCLRPGVLSPRLADILRKDMSQIDTLTLGALESSNAIARACGVDSPTTIESAEHLASLLLRLESHPAAIPANWLSHAGIARAQNAAAELGQTDAQRTAHLARVERLFIGALPGARSAPLLAEIRAVIADAARWERVAGATWAQLILAEPDSSEEHWRSVVAAATACNAAAQALGNFLGLTAKALDEDSTRHAMALATRLAAVGTIPDAWTDIQTLNSAVTQISAARSIAEQLLDVERALFARFDDEILGDVDDAMRVRYKTDYSSRWRWFKSGYRHDQRTIRGRMKAPAPLTVAEALEAIEQVLAVNRLRKRWDEISPLTQSALGHLFKGLNTDWDSVAAKIESTLGAFREYPSLVLRLHQILVDAEAISSMVDLNEASAKALDWLNSRTAPHMANRPVPFSAFAADAGGYADAVACVARVVREAGLAGSKMTVIHDLSRALEACADLHELESAAAIEASAWEANLGPFFDLWATDFPALSKAVEWTRDLVSSLPIPMSSEIVDAVTVAPDPETWTGHSFRLNAAIAAFAGAWQEVNDRFQDRGVPWQTWRCADFGAVRAWCADLAANAEFANDWQEYRAAADALDRALGEGAADAVRLVTDRAGEVPGIVMRHVYLTWLEYIYANDDALRVAPRDLEAVAQMFRELDRQLPEVARERVRAKCRSDIAGINGSGGYGEVGTLTHQLSLRRRQMPVRRLVASIPNLLLKMKPCLMMSPLAVSQYLPRGASESATMKFDAVIFDEASQIFPEDAVPAIARGQQCIVVGDRQQLPPSSFFRTVANDDDEDFDEENEDLDINRLSGVESILDVLIGMQGIGVDDVYLQVHYRSQHDSLIRYSNHYFYEDRLLTFPAACVMRPGLGVRSKYVPDGRFDAGGSRTNRIEANEVVDAALALMRTQPLGESIGVVALSRAQAELIEKLIDARRLDERAFDERFSPDLREKFFVKNLENVQGDERDHIILSVGYGPTSGSGLVPNRFGPVNLEGGHRRLNVAVSRARKSLTVLHSLKAEDIRSEAQGAMLLRRYLEFAREGEAALEGATDGKPSGEAESPFEEAVGRSLEQRGYRIVRQLGCAKYFIDIAVLSEDGGSYDLAIECDGARYHRSPSARDRDRIRQEILEKLGWRGRFHRVWSTNWIKNASGELEAIEAAIRRSRQLPRTGYAVDEPAPSAVRRAVAQVTGEPRGEHSGPGLGVDGEPLVLSNYLESNLARFTVSADLREESPDRVAEVVTAVVTDEGPVHIDMVVERIRQHYGLQRAGGRVRAAVEDGIVLATRQGAVAWLSRNAPASEARKFLVLPGDAEVIPRGTFIDGRYRPVDQICEAEYRAAIFWVIRAVVGASRAEVTTAVARALGYGRTGGNIEYRIGQAIDRLLRAGKLEERLGSLVVCE